MLLIDILLTPNFNFYRVYTIYLFIHLHKYYILSILQYKNNSFSMYKKIHHQLHGVKYIFSNGKIVLKLLILKVFT